MELQSNEELKFDHLLHAVHDPEATRLVFESTLGWRTVVGGEHPGWGTYNALAYFELSYIEWIGVRNREIAAQSYFGRQVLDAGLIQEGPFQFALRTRRMDHIAAQWAAKGLRYDGPVPGSRTLPDGRIIRWRLLFPAQADPASFLLPFLIEWEGTDETQRERLVRQGALPTKGSSPYRLLAVHSAVRSLQGVRRRWEPYYGALSISLQNTEGLGTGLGCRIGDVSICFWDPAHPLLREELYRCGERPFQIDLADSATFHVVENQGTTRQVSETKLSSVSLHGLRVTIGSPH